MQLIGKAELSPTETQSLIETLLHKQAPTETSSEWLQVRHLSVLFVILMGVQPRVLQCLLS